MRERKKRAAEGPAGEIREEMSGDKIRTSSKTTIGLEEKTLPHFQPFITRNE